MSTVIEITDAVVGALNGHAFSQPFTADRCYVPAFDLKDMKDLHVTVVPRGLEMTTASRSLLQDDVQIDVAVQKKLPADASGDKAAIDVLMGLVQEIADFVRATGRFGDMVWVKTENKPIYSPEHLEQLRQFTAVLTLTLRAMR
ncbi:MAG: hypothetical protein BWX88_04607 [Planctomycetes bacterium ADurb.Bin126]|nr:MAG: hypothetical protein BWX88_04607 [Planctomycetes bacterium ADurb.Bin126]